MNKTVTARILMCPPDHFEVVSVINDWMDPDAWKRDEAANKKAVMAEWETLKSIYEDLGAEVLVMPAAEGLPDMVYMANCAVTLNGRVIPATFRHPERQGESPLYEDFFLALADAGVVEEVTTLPDGMVLEGTGDALWDQNRQQFFFGFGPRSDLHAAVVLNELFGARVVPLQLLSDTYYHLDTCLCLLSGGEALYVPEAFDEDGLEKLNAEIGAKNLIPLSDEDAAVFAANSVCIGKTVVMPPVSEALEDTLNARGYTVRRVDLPVFKMGGGSAFCLTKILSHTFDEDTAE